MFPEVLRFILGHDIMELFPLQIFLIRYILHFYEKKKSYLMYVNLNTDPYKKMDTAFKYKLYLRLR